MKRALIAGAVLIVVIGAAGFVVYTLVGRTGSSELENWIGRSLAGVVESHLTAKVEFDRLDYQTPGTVILGGFKLIGEDQAPLIEVGRVQLTLAEMPRLNHPIRIEKIELEAPSLYFRQDADGELLGWSSLVQAAVLEEGLDAAPAEFRLSEVLVMRRIEIRDGQLEYFTSADEQPMILRGLTTSLDTAPQPDEPGWYRLEGEMSREPQLAIKLDGRFNLDTMLLEVARLTMNMTLEESQYETLPPQIQTIVRRHALRGQLDATLVGSIPATDFLASAAHLELTLRDAFASFGESVLPVDEVRATAAMADRSIDLNATAQLLSGRAGAEATVSLEGAMPMRARYGASKINLRQTLATANPDEPPSYDGILQTSGTVETSALTPLESIDGGGTLNVERGRLINLPVISALVRKISSPSSRQKYAPGDRAAVEYRFTPDHLAISEFELTSALIVARGDGKVFYDQRLSLAVNAGPMEKVQNNLGKIGDLIGKITDSFVKYYVGGTISNPSVSVKPLGIGAGN